VWKNIVEPGRPQMTTWRMRIACWIPKATNINSEHAIIIAFPLQRRLHECASVLRYTHITCLVLSVTFYQRLHLGQNFKSVYILHFQHNLKTSTCEKVHVPSIYEDVIQYQHKWMQNAAAIKKFVHHNWLSRIFQTGETK
jgi:hypothetical protein